MSPRSLPHLRRCGVALGIATLLGACSGLRPAAVPFPTFYSLDSAPVALSITDAPSALSITGAPGAMSVTGTHSTLPLSTANPSPATALTLIIDPPHAASGFDSQRIIYVREAHKIEYFAHSEWVDTPARMLAPLLVGALEGSGAFRAVVLTPSTAAGELRLVTEIIRLQQEFGATPSRVRFTLRAYLLDEKTRHVLARREFDATLPAASEDPHGGVVAASRVVTKVLGDLTAFCVEAMRTATLGK